MSSTEDSEWADPGDPPESSAPSPVTPDQLHQAETQLAPGAASSDREDQQRRLLADTAIVRALRADGYQGQRTDRLLGELSAYGWPIMQYWIQTGEVFAHCAARGRAVPRPKTGFAWTRDEHTELATETILKAVPFFRLHALEQGAWEPRRGASLATYFLGACINCFPQVYRSWWRQQTHLQSFASSDADALAQLPDPRHANPEHITLLRDQAARALAQIEDPVLIAALTLRAMGYTERDAAKAVGLTQKALERRTSKQRAKLRKTEQANETDEQADATADPAKGGK